MPAEPRPKPAKPDAWAQMLDEPGIAESGGEETNEGVDFSRYWAMSAILGLEESGASDYALVFEFLQDVTLFDCPSSPKSAVLYQVKKKEKGVWKPSHLCASKGKTGTRGRATSGKRLKGRSPLGKLYMSLERATPEVQQAQGVFVSNASCDLKSIGGGAVPGYCRVSLSSIHSADAEYIEGRLTRELKKKKPLPHMNAMSLEQTRVHPASMRETVQGMVADFMDKNHPEIPMSPGRLVERLLQSFSSVSGRKGGCSCLSEIMKKKGFTRQQFTAILAELSKVRSAATKIEEALSDLKAAGLATRVAERTHSEAIRLRTIMMRDPAVKQTLKWKLAVSTARANQHLESYSPIVSAVMKAVEDELRKQRGPIPESDTLRALAVLAIKEVDEEPSSFTTKSANETK